MIVPVLASVVLYTQHRHEEKFTLERKWRFLILALSVIVALTTLHFKTPSTTSLLELVPIVYTMVCVWYLLQEEQTTLVWRNLMIAGLVMFSMMIITAGGLMIYLSEQEKQFGRLSPIPPGWR